jgi:hypothetical protein
VIFLATKSGNLMPYSRASSSKKRSTYYQELAELRLK